MGCRKASVIVGLAVAVLSTSASASPPMDFLGIGLGQPLTVAECPLEDSRFASFTRYKIYVDPALRPCFKSRTAPGQGLSSLPGGTGTLNLELGAVPHVIDGTFATVTLVNGAPEKITAFTRGHAVQDQALELLIQKYGKPTELKTEEVQNRMGATFGAMHAEWKLDGLSVLFFGIGTKIDTGYIVVSTPAGEAASEAEAALRKAQEPSL